METTHCVLAASLTTSLAVLRPLSTACSLVVRNDTTWHVHVRGHPLPPSSLILADFGSHLDSVTASMLLARLSDLHTCPGNPEPKFVSLANAKRNIGSSCRAIMKWLLMLMHMGQ